MFFQSVLVFLAVAKVVQVRAVRDSGQEEQNELCVEIVSPGYYGQDTNTALNSVGPAFDSAIDYSTKFFSRYNVTHRYLQEENVKLCSDLEINAQDMLARWYYRRNHSNCAAVIITSGQLSDLLTRIT
jgi:hypothetical protein